MFQKSILSLLSSCLVLKIAFIVLDIFFLFCLEGEQKKSLQKVRLEALHMKQEKDVFLL